MGIVLGINHVGISVADLGVAHRFWVDGLLCTDAGGFGWPEGTIPADEALGLSDTCAQVALLAAGSAYVELFCFRSPAPVARPADSPGIAEIRWGVDNVSAAVARAQDSGGTVIRRLAGANGPITSAVLRCPDGTTIAVVRASPTLPLGLAGVTLQVAEVVTHPLLALEIPGPVTLDVISIATQSNSNQGAARAGPHSDSTAVASTSALPVLASVPRPCDYGANHLCLDVEGIRIVRAGMGGTSWHHAVTSSSGGIASVSYGTTHDGVLIELLENHQPTASLSRTRLAPPPTPPHFPPVSHEGAPGGPRGL